MTTKNDWIHWELDRATEHERLMPLCDDDLKKLEKYQRALSLLKQCSNPSPEGFADRVLAALPERTSLSFWERWLVWLKYLRTRRVPAFACALSFVFLTIAVSYFFKSFEVTPNTDVMSSVVFTVHLPDAKHVEVIGNFTNWQRGEVVLSGPDPSGDWHGHITLPPGTYEYLFLIDRKELLADPHAAAYRNDGFGHKNAFFQL